MIWTTETKTRFLTLVRMETETALKLTTPDEPPTPDEPEPLVILADRLPMADQSIGYIRGIEAAIKVLYPDDTTTLSIVVHHLNRAQAAMYKARQIVAEEHARQTDEITASLVAINNKLDKLSILGIK